MAHATTGRRVTAADIAREVGVSRATVGFVLNDTPGQTISEPTRRKVLDAAERLGYRPHLAARALASGRSQVVLMVLPDWPIDFSMSTHIEEAALTLDEAGLSLVTWTPHEHGTARPLWETLQPDAVMSMLPLSDAQRADIARTGASVVEPERGDDPDPYGVQRAPAAQVAHLLAGGHTRLMFAATDDPRLHELATQRFEVARAAAEAAGAQIERVDVPEHPRPMAERPDVAAWRDAGVTAVVCYNDTIAATVIGAALRVGLEVPGDLAVIGHDDAPVASLMVPSISTIRVDTAGIGRYLARLCLSELAGAPRPDAPAAIRAEVVARESA